MASGEPMSGIINRLIKTSCKRLLNMFGCDKGKKRIWFQGKDGLQRGVGKNY